MTVAYKSLVGLLLIFSSTLSAEGNPRTLVVSGDWRFSSASIPEACQLESSIAGSKKQTMHISAAAAEDNSTLFIRGDLPKVGRSGDSANVEVIVTPSGSRFTSTAKSWVDPMSRSQVLTLEDLPDSFLTALGEATGLILQWEGKSYLAIDVRGSRRAVEAVRKCNQAALKKWGLNADLINSLKQKPRPVSGVQVFSPDDYPMSALRNDEQGTAVVRFTVGVDGRAKNCATVASSGSEALDEQSCKSILARARFSPAVDQSGKIIAVEVAEAVRWALG